MKFVIRPERLCVVILLVLFFSAGISFAEDQEQAYAIPSAQEIIAKLKQALDLSDEQTSQITPIIKEKVSQAKEIVSQGGDRDTMKIKAEALRKETESKLSQVLTLDQLEQSKKKQEQILKEKYPEGYNSNSENGFVSVGNGKVN